MISGTLEVPVALVEGGFRVGLWQLLGGHASNRQYLEQTAHMPQRLLCCPQSHSIDIPNKYKQQCLHGERSALQDPDRAVCVGFGLALLWASTVSLHAFCANGLDAVR